MTHADPAVLAVVNNYKAAVASVRAQAAAFASASWGELQSYRDADMAALLAEVVPFMRGAKEHTATLTDAYLAALAAEALGEPSNPVGVPGSIVSEDSLRGVDDSIVYGRAFVTIWTALANGDGIDKAAGLGLARLQTIIATDLQLAKTHSARYSMTASQHVVGYRRVTDGHCCALCESASSRVYHKRDLMPIHPHCSCDVEPIYGTADPGRLPAGQSSGDDAGDTPAVHLHGEIGPTLTVRGQAFTGPSDVG